MINREVKGISFKHGQYARLRYMAEMMNPPRERHHTASSLIQGWFEVNWTPALERKFRAREKRLVGKRAADK